MYSSVELRRLNEQVAISILENTTHHGVIKSKTQAKSDVFYNFDVSIAILKNTAILEDVFNVVVLKFTCW